MILRNTYICWVLYLLLGTGGVFADSKECAECHTEIARTYARSGMAKAFSVPDASSVPDPTPYLHRASNTWYEIIAKDGGWFQRWWQLGHKGQEASAGESRIDYVMGSGNHVRTYLHRTGRGTLIELPLAWYAEKGGTWALNPGFDTSDPPVGRKIGYDCMFCHNAYPAIPSKHDEPVFASDPPLPQGIDCQRCHGQGTRHVQAARQAQPKVAEIRAAIVNPARLSKERAMEVCMQCHLETTSRPLPNSIRRYERGPFSYDAGEPLSAFQLSFDHAPGSGREGKFEIVNSVYRLRQSKCFLQSQGKLGCTTCHNPHDVQHGQAASETSNKACAVCHAPTTIRAANHPAGGGADCVSCHMPKRRSEDVVHAVMTDHLIQRRAPSHPLAELAELPGEKMEYRGEVVPYGDKDDLYTAVAQVTHRSNLQRGIVRLQAEIAKRKPQQAEFYMELGDALQRVGRSAEAVVAYRTGLEKKPDWALFYARMAMPLRAMGKSREPLDAMKKAVSLEPDNPEFFHNLGLLQSGLGDKAGAVDSFRKSIALDPEFADSRTSLGAVLVEIGKPQEGEAELRAALRIRPASQVAHGQMAYLLANRGDLDEAVWHFARGGSSAVNHFSHGIALARLNRLDDACEQLRKSLQIDPKQPVARELLGRLLAATGKLQEAAAQYKEAIRLRPNFGQAHLSLGTLLAGQGNAAGATAEFRLAQTDADPQVRQLAAEGLAGLARRR